MDTYEVAVHPKWHNYPDHFSEALAYTVHPGGVLEVAYRQGKTIMSAIYNRDAWQTVDVSINDKEDD